MTDRISFWGKVRPGKKRGRIMNFPTANIKLHKKIPEGIYLSYAKINKKRYNSLTFIGASETFAELDYKAEVFILNFNENIYDRMISVLLLQKIRDNQKFNSMDELVKQMEDDKEKAEIFFADK